MRRSGTTAAIAVCAVIWAAAPVKAQAPERVAATFGDWTVLCMQPSDGPKMCELVHQQINEGQAEAVGQVNIARRAKSPFKLIIQIPPNVLLEGGVRFVLDDKIPAIAATLRWCINTRCRADVDLTDAMMKTLRARTEPGSVQYKEASERDVSTPVSFRGFAAALAYMEKQ